MSTELIDWFCKTCGVGYAAASEAQPPASCVICEDERQWVPPGGQQWITRDELHSSHTNNWKEEEPDIWSVETSPKFGIGQRAHLIRTTEGNLLWDCISVLDEESVAWVRELGGLRAVAVSHPHYYSAMREWSSALGDVPVYIHADDQDWVVTPPRSLELWRGESCDLFGGLRLVRSGGHFAGYQVLHHPSAAEGRGALFAGDQPQVCFDGRWVTFMYSYPNWIPFDAATVNRIAESLEPLRYERLYGAFGRNLAENAKETVARSSRRYLRAIGSSL